MGQVVMYLLLVLSQYTPHRGRTLDPLEIPPERVRAFLQWKGLLLDADGEGELDEKDEDSSVRARHPDEADTRSYVHLDEVCFTHLRLLVPVPPYLDIVVNLVRSGLTLL